MKDAAAKAAQLAAVKAQMSARNSKALFQFARMAN